MGKIEEVEIRLRNFFAGCIDQLHRRCQTNEQRVFKLEDKIHALAEPDEGEPQTGRVLHVRKYDGELWVRANEVKCKTDHIEGENGLPFSTIKHAVCGACGHETSRVNLTARMLRLCKCESCDTIGALNGCSPPDVETGQKSISDPLNEPAFRFGDLVKDKDSVLLGIIQKIEKDTAILLSTLSNNVLWWHTKNINDIEYIESNCHLWSFEKVFAKLTKG